MEIDQDQNNVIRIECTDTELRNLTLMVLYGGRPEISTVAELLRFHIEYLSENAFRCVPEPLLDSGRG